MNRPTVRLGPAAGLLTVIAICLAILAILTFTTARADLRLAEKYADTVRARYALESEGQKYMAGLAAAPGTAPPADADGVIRVDMERDGYRLSIALEPDGAGGFRTVGWRHEKPWEEEPAIGDLWSGFFGTGGIGFADP